jgi:hypothetical protein
MGGAATVLQLSPPPVRRRMAAEREPADPFAGDWAAVGRDLSAAMARGRASAGSGLAAVGAGPDEREPRPPTPGTMPRPPFDAIASQLIADEAEHQQSISAQRIAADTADENWDQRGRRVSQVYLLVLISVAGTCGLLLAALGHAVVAALIGGGGTGAFGLMLLSICRGQQTGARPL